MSRLEFGSPDWLSVLGDALVSVLAEADLRGVTFSVCEEYSDPPAHLAGDDGRSIAWHLICDDGHLSFALGPLDDPTSWARTDYTAACRLASLSMADLSLEELRAVQLEQERMMVEGRCERRGGIAAVLPQVKPYLDRVHEIVAARTRPAPDQARP